LTRVLWTCGYQTQSTAEKGSREATQEVEGGTSQVGEGE
jgi:hypothetical protein